MTLVSGFIVFAILVVTATMSVVAYATFFAGPKFNRWPKTVGLCMMGILALLLAFLAWAGGAS